ncbi:MAG: flavin reductase family protein [Candidatus Alcyoniella australis]|nr:flavin reductase family protein [Candidatus Alcyoniella australis]
MSDANNDVPDASILRDALAKLHYGLYILTVEEGGEVNGMPVSWVSQVSFDPPLVMIAVHSSRYTHQMLESAGSFALNLLKPEQAALVPRFKLKGEQRSHKFDGLELERGSIGAPLLRDSVASIECEIVKTFVPGDHTLFFGLVRDVRLNEPDSPVLGVDDFGKGYG